MNNDLWLYQAPLGSIATISVTHNLGCLHTPYAGNFGQHVQDDAQAVSQRRLALDNALTKPIQWLNQVHGVTVFEASPSTTSHAPTADAAVTAHTSIAIAVMTADCLPVAFSAQNADGHRAIAVAHAGWRGLQAGVLSKTVQALQTLIPGATTHAHLGPCIGVAQFEVGSEVRDAFTATNRNASHHFTPKGNDKLWCDLESLARDELTGMGVQAVSGGGWCTVSDPRLASYRRQALTGRFATVVSLN